jgi:4-hydroxy-tetrahydrodipicolinate synthase
MLEGVYVANVTPFREDASLSLDVEAYVAHVEWLAERGVRGVVPFGTNGEGPSVTAEEKLRTLDALFERDLSIEIVPTVAEGTLPETLSLVEALGEYAATAIMVLPPYYFKPAPTEGLRRFYEPVMEASRHPIVLYHIPKYAVPVPEELVSGLPVWGVKDSGGDSGYTERVLATGRGVLLGTEDDLVSKLALGPQGMISALANFLPERMLQMHRLALSGDKEAALELSERLQQVRARTKEYASPAVLKKLAGARNGVDMGTVRPPLVPAPADYEPAGVLETAGVA